MHQVTARDFVIMRFSGMLLIFSILAIVTGPLHGKVVMCPFFATSLLGTGSEFNIETADFNLCTHAICSITWNRLQDPWSKQYGDKFDRTFVNLRRQFPHLKIILGVYNLPSGEEINSMYQTLFVQTVADFIRRFKFNGLDVNWDYKKQSEHLPEVQSQIKENVLHLAQSLRKELHGISLVFSFIATEKVLLEAHDYKALSEHLDYMDFMVVDDFDAFQNKFTISDILKAKGISHLEHTFDDIVKLGVSPAKMLMGLPFGGTEFKNLEDTTNIFELVDSDLSYNGFCHLLFSDMQSRWNRFYDIESSLAMSKMENKGTGEIRVIVFDSSRSVANKISLAVQKNLAGIKTSLINTDDASGSCALDQDTFDDFPFQLINMTALKRHDATFPLLKTINEVITMTTPIIPDETISAYTSESSTLYVIIVIFVIFILIILGLVAVARKFC
ncbi:probable chitinase 2 isoform X2 [Sitodiplosis mosellana]|uniref:probable chitinase 2 isoform X2 n=1 Tax=Sitodiplosis mosellana TaxID=263140 RepID=UPI002444EF41|nr:probable chitinase 2 isoform X2 [Sitodiplosis mosellana]